MSSFLSKKYLFLGLYGVCAYTFEQQNNTCQYLLVSNDAMCHGTRVILRDIPWSRLWIGRVALVFCNVQKEGDVSR